MENQRPSVHVSLATTPSPGAVGLLTLSGRGATGILAQLTGLEDWPTAKLRLADLGGVDQGLVVRLRDGLVHVMPHGGPRVVGKLIDQMTQLGAVYEANPHPRDAYPEAATEFEADMLACVARAASPGAIDALFAQPVLWRRWFDAAKSYNADKFRSQAQEILQHSDSFDRLIDPPTVVVVGQPNVGKSTLTNQMLGRSASLVADLPGTTRDWVAGLAEIGSVAVRWTDTPGLRDADDALERQAIGLAQQVIEQADVLIAMRDPSIDLPGLDSIRRWPDLWVMNKVDRADEFATHSGHDDDCNRDKLLPISAKTGGGVDRLGMMVLQHLGLTNIQTDRLWAFSPMLRQELAEGAVDKLRGYITG